MKSTSYSNTILLLIGVGFILFIGKSIFIPIIFSLLLYFLIGAIRRFLDKNTLIKSKIPSWFKNLFSAFIIFSLLGFLINAIYSNGYDFIHSLEKYQGNLERMLLKIEHQFNLNISSQVEESINKFNISNHINTIIDSITSTFGSLIIVLFYVLFFFLEESNFKKKMRLVFSDEQKRIETELLFKNIQKSITNYIGLKSFISFLSSIICFILLYFYQIDSPFLWAICIFIFNFIPVVGPFLAVVLPSFFALIQFENFQISVYLLLFLSAIQLVIGNFLEPKLLGNSLNISPLVALVSLSIWGAFWGVVGMVLSVPFTVIIIILLAHFSSTKSVAIMLSNKGDV